AIQHPLLSTDPRSPQFYTLSLHDALPISIHAADWTSRPKAHGGGLGAPAPAVRSSCDRPTRDRAAPGDTAPPARSPPRSAGTRGAPPRDSDRYAGRLTIMRVHQTLTFAAIAVQVACSQPDGPGATISFESVSAGGSHTCGLSTEGPTYCWGSNTFAQLGGGPSTLLESHLLSSGRRGRR